MLYENCTRFIEEIQAVYLNNRYMDLVILVGEVDTVDNHSPAFLSPHMRGLLTTQDGYIRG